MHALFQSARLFSIPDHGRADTALDGVSGVPPFNLPEDYGFGSIDHPSKSDEWRPAYRKRVILVNNAHGFPPCLGFPTALVLMFH